jgi:hypothetical protein
MTTLKDILLINAVSSGATGLGLTLAPSLVASLFEVSQTTPFIMVGVFLIIFAAVVFITGRKKTLNNSAVRLIITLDSLWFFASIGIVVLQLFNLSVTGYFLIGAVAAWVGLMAILQYLGLKHYVVTR